MRPMRILPPLEDVTTDTFLQPALLYLAGGCSGCAKVA